MRRENYANYHVMLKLQESNISTDVERIIMGIKRCAIIDLCSLKEAKSVLGHYLQSQEFLSGVKIKYFLYQKYTLC